MERIQRINPAPFVIVFFVGLMSATRFAPHVTRPDAVGLLLGGFGAGAGMVGFIAALKSRRAPTDSTRSEVSR